VGEGTGGATVADRVLSTLGSLGENIVLRRAAFCHAGPHGLVGVAAHGGSSPALGRLASMVHVEATGASEAALRAAETVANKVRRWWLALS
jgi:elongation factor Ts